MQTLFESKYVDLVRYRCTIEVIGQSKVYTTDEDTRKLVKKPSHAISRVVEYIRILDHDDNTVRMLPITSLYKNIDSYIQPGLECTMYFADSHERGGNCSIFAMVIGDRYVEDIDSFYASLSGIGRLLPIFYVMIAATIVLGIATIIFLIGFVFLFIAFFAIFGIIKLKIALRSLPKKDELRKLISADVQKVHPGLQVL